MIPPIGINDKTEFPVFQLVIRPMMIHNLIDDQHGWYTWICDLFSGYFSAQRD